MKYKHQTYLSENACIDLCANSQIITRVVSRNNNHGHQRK